MSWKIYASSLQGGTHIANGMPCQDSSNYKKISTGFGDYMILVASDGCGTARHSDKGANIITSEVVECLSYWLRNSTVVPELPDLLIFSLGHANQCLTKTATRLSISVIELAATCACLIVGPDRFAAAQIGDGIITGISHGICGCLFWPNQEYANVTHTLTAKDWRRNIQIYSSAPNSVVPESWLIVTDGIQSISCDYEKKTPVPGFTSVLVEKLRILSQTSCESAQAALEALLRSERVDSVVTDDKTIITAFR